MGNTLAQVPMRQIVVHNRSPMQEDSCSSDVERSNLRVLPKPLMMLGEGTRYESIIEWKELVARAIGWDGSRRTKLESMKIWDYVGVQSLRVKSLRVQSPIIADNFEQWPMRDHR
jgi:hypothetical protein